MPAPMVEEDIKEGRLVRLDLPDAKSGIYSLEAIYRADTPPGPAATWLIQRFKAQAEIRKGNAKVTTRAAKGTAGPDPRRRLQRTIGARNRKPSP
jgi:hypothetical protein